MKLGISYNLFDGEELLKDSIKSIRDNVDHISIVYQTESNFGNPCSEELVPLINDLKSTGLVDEIYKYKPRVNKGGHYNEITKRNIGLYLSEGAKCTHHMAMDSDEFYISEQFKYMCEVMTKEEYDSAACQMVTYYKHSNYVLDPNEDYYVSLLFKIRQGKEYVLGIPFPVLVDPTRRMEPAHCKIFNREEIEMHHMSYVRNNIAIKLQNSSASPNFNNINKVVEHFNNWEYPQQGLMFKPNEEYVTLKKIDKLFL